MWNVHDDLESTYNSAVTYVNLDNLPVYKEQSHENFKAVKSVSSAVIEATTAKFLLSKNRLWNHKRMKLNWFFEKQAVTRQVLLMWLQWRIYWFTFPVKLHDQIQGRPNFPQNLATISNF